MVPCKNPCTSKKRTMQETIGIAMTWGTILRIANLTYCEFTATARRNLIAAPLTLIKEQALMGFGHYGLSFVVHSICIIIALVHWDLRAAKLFKLWDNAIVAAAANETRQKEWWVIWGLKTWRSSLCCIQSRVDPHVDGLRVLLYQQGWHYDWVFALKHLCNRSIDGKTLDTAYIVWSK